jgi:uncharacterized protein (DUF1778 family)
MRANVPSKARGVLAIRLSSAERAILEAAAANRPEYLTTFVRETALDAARRELAAKPTGR